MLLDSSVDRVEKRAQDDFDAAVEATRIGYVVARDRKAAQRWDRRVMRRNRDAQTAANLEASIAALRSTHPEYVVTG